MTPEVFPILLNLSMAIPLGLNPLLLLTIDLMTELCPAISLAYESPESDIMERKPRNCKTDRLVSIPVLLYSLITAGLCETFVKIGNLRRRFVLTTTCLIVTDFHFHSWKELHLHNLLLGHLIWWLNLMARCTQMFNSFRYFLKYKLAITLPLFWVSLCTFGSVELELRAYSITASQYIIF